MHELTPEQIEEFKRISKEVHGRDISDAEARDGAYGLARLAELFLEMAIEQARRDKRMEKEPKGFHLEEGKVYSCCICHDSISGQQTWYDQSGIKCLLCQRAINRRIIPRSVCTKPDSWVASWRISHDLNIHPSTIQKFIRQGELKARNILNNDGRIHYQVFLLKENQEFIKNHQPTRVIPKVDMTYENLNEKRPRKTSPL